MSSASLSRRYIGCTSHGAQNCSRSKRALASSRSAATLGAANCGPASSGPLELGKRLVMTSHTVAGEQHLFAAGFKVGHELLHLADGVLAVALHAARHRPVPARGTPPRRASSAATISRSTWRSGYATRSRLDTSMTGTRSACAMTVAVVTPTRRPVNSPGPMPTAIAAS